MYALSKSKYLVKICCCFKKKFIFTLNSLNPHPGKVSQVQDFGNQTLIGQKVKLMTNTKICKYRFLIILYFITIQWSFLYLHEWMLSKWPVVHRVSSARDNMFRCRECGSSSLSTSLWCRNNSGAFWISAKERLIWLMKCFITVLYVRVIYEMQTSSGLVLYILYIYIYYIYFCNYFTVYKYIYIYIYIFVNCKVVTHYYLCILVNFTVKYAHSMYSIISL